MKRTRLIMGMPVTVEVVDPDAPAADLEAVFDHFKAVDQRFSTYKSDSEITSVNNGLPESEWSHEMKTVLALCEQTRRETDGYFDIWQEGNRDPSGLVKGWAIKRAANLLRSRGRRNFYIDAGGDIQPHGTATGGRSWRVGIRNPFDRDEIIKSIAVTTEGVATSGTYIRGQHIYDPHQPGAELDEVAAITVIGPDIYEADRFATAAFAMGRRGIEFIAGRSGFEGYMVDRDRQAVLTSGFASYEVQPV